MLSDATRDALLAFRRERDWEQFHTPKNLAVAITVEAAELLEQFQWTTSEGVPVEALPAIRDEIADVCILLTYLAHDLGVELDAAVRAKVAKNGDKYPTDANMRSSQWTIHSDKSNTPTSGTGPS